MSDLSVSNSNVLPEIPAPSDIGENSLSETSATELVDVVYLDQDSRESGAGGGDGDAGGGQNASDRNGLAVPNAAFDLKAVMLAISETQSEVTESQIELSGDMVDGLQATQKKQAAKNIKKMQNARKKAEESKVWSDIAKYGGYVAIGMTLAVGVATVNPALVIAGGCMIATTGMNESGTTEDMINALGGGDATRGTLLAAGILVATSGLSGGFAGATMLTTLGPGLLATPENLEAMGMDSDDAVATSIGIGIASSLLTGLCMSGVGANLGSQSMSKGSQALGASDDIANTTTKASSSVNGASQASSKSSQVLDDASNATGTASRSASVSSNATNTTSNAANQIDDATKVAKAVDDVAEASEDTLTHLRRVVAKVGKLFEGRLENAMNRGVRSMLSKIDTEAASATLLARTQSRMMMVTSVTQGVTEMVIGVSQGIKADFNLSIAKREAKAKWSDEKSNYAASREKAWSALMTRHVNSFNESVSDTADAFAVHHSATFGHLQYQPS